MNSTHPSVRQTFYFGHRALLGMFAAFSLLTPALCAAPADQLDFFETRIRPVLVERCYECHSAESKKLKGGLHLDSREGMLTGGDSKKAAVVPNHPEKSLLIEAIRYGNPDLEMPPKNRLPANVVADFESWIRLGALDPRTN